MQLMAGVGDRITLPTLYDVDGTPVRLRDQLDRPLLVVLVRYYGCMPCRDFLHQLAGIRPELDEAGMGLLGVGGAADFQARHLMEHGIDYPLLLDPDHALYGELDLKRIPWWTLASPVTWWRYLRAARRARQGRITGHPLQAPGLAILDTDATVRYLHRGRTLGDYPSLAEIRAVVHVIAGQRPDEGGSTPRG